jgi:Family of unknown function (DUF6152)
MRLRPMLRIMLLAIAAFAGAPSFAHHGGALEYDATKVIGPYTGTVTRFEFSYPHPTVHFEVKGEGGTVVQWAALIRPTPAVLRKHGWNRESMKPGDTIVITLLPHKSVENFGNTLRLTVNGTLLAESVRDLQ